MARITWRDTGVPSFAGALYGMANAGKAFNTALGGLSTLGGDIRDREKAKVDAANLKATEGFQAQLLNASTPEARQAILAQSQSSGANQLTLAQANQRQQDRGLTNQTNQLRVDALQNAADSEKRVKETGNYFADFQEKDGVIDMKAAREQWLKPKKDGGVGGTSEEFKNRTKLFEDNTGITQQRVADSVIANQQFDLLKQANDLNSKEAIARAKNSAYLEKANLRSGGGSSKGKGKGKGKGKSGGGQDGANFSNDVSPVKIRKDVINGVGEDNFLDFIPGIDSKIDEQADVVSAVVPYKRFGLSDDLIGNVVQGNTDGSAANVGNIKKQLSAIQGAMQKFDMPEAEALRYIAKADAGEKNILAEVKKRKTGRNK